MSRQILLSLRVCGPHLNVTSALLTVFCALTLVACGDIGDTNSTGEDHTAVESFTGDSESSNKIVVWDLDTKVDRFDAAAGGFASVALRDTGPNTEFFLGTAFYRVDDDGGVFRVPAIERAAFDATHAPYERESWRFPSRHDVAWVPIDENEVPAGHHRVADLPAGTRFVFQHKFFVIEEESAGRYVAETGDVLRPVLSTSHVAAEILVDLVVTDVEGLVETISGTPDHAFWIPALRDYRPMGDLPPGTVLRTDGGQEVTVVRNSRRYGEFSVHNLIVEGQHNYFVGGSGHDAPWVLAHNGKECNGKQQKKALPSSQEQGPIIGWGTDQASFKKTQRLAEGLTPEDVQKMAAKGLNKEWVEHQLKLYQKAIKKYGGVEAAPKINLQVLPRKMIMEKVLKWWPEDAGS